MHSSPPVVVDAVAVDVVGPPPPRRPKLKDRMVNVLTRETRLLTAIFVLVFLENVPYGKYILYPFTIFSTWIHECCHGLAAVLLGGHVDSLYLYEDGSGLAYTFLPDDNNYNWKRAVVASAGYTGTALAGGILLLFRRTMLGPPVGTVGLGVLMVVSCVFWIRTTFGIIMLITMGAVLMLIGWRVKAGKGLGTIFAFLAAVCCLNAITSIHALWESDEVTVNGEDRDSDAETVSQHIGMPYWFWALTWFCQALAMLALGLLYPFEPSDQQEAPLHSKLQDPSSQPPASMESTAPYHNMQVV